MGKHLTADICQEDGNIKREYISFEPFLAPVYVSKSSSELPPATTSKGNARDRATLRYASEISSIALALAHQQVGEMMVI
jgi:hypothetical protein